MRILELDHSGGAIGRLLSDARAREKARTGLHVSAVLKAWFYAIDPKQFTLELSDDQIHGYQEIGNVLEDLVAQRLARRLAGWEKPVPRLHRGLTGSADGWSPRTRTLHEIKACWKSERHFEAVLGGCTSRQLDLLDLVRECFKLYTYICQLLVYGEIYDSTRGQLHILFVNGNYKPPAPKPRTFTLLWTAQERAAFFNQLLEFAGDVGLLAPGLKDPDAFVTTLTQRRQLPTTVRTGRVPDRAGRRR